MRRVVASLAILAALVTTGCGGPAGSAGARFVIERIGSGVTDPIAVSVTGLQPGEPVVLSASAATLVRAGRNGAAVHVNGGHARAHQERVTCSIERAREPRLSREIS